jgi:signal transduction histidine kinase
MKELVQSISHDLKTPLAVMSVNLESLSGLAATQSDAGYQRHVRAAYQKNLDLQRLIQNLFEVSRIETNRNLYSPKWTPLLPLLAGAKQKYDDYLEDYGLTLEIGDPGDIEISTDSQKIWSVFDNIIYNAVRHTSSGGITITARKDGESATITITDTGCGIAPEHLPHVFERFYKGSQARNANEGESGLGLYIVKSVMEGCGGSVAIESEPAGDGRPGKGTSVILTFPARAAAEK